MRLKYEEFEYFYSLRIKFEFWRHKEIMMYGYLLKPHKKWNGLVSNIMNLPGEDNEYRRLPAMWNRLVLSGAHLRFKDTPGIVYTELVPRFTDEDSISEIS